jgi:hypothetical protein
VRAHKEWLRRLARHTLDFVEGHGKLRESGAEVTAYPGPVKNTGDNARLLFEN